MPGPTPPYEGYILAGLPLAGSIPGKFYATEIRGREDRSQEWAPSGMDFRSAKGRFEKMLEETEAPRIPIVAIAMPQLIRVYMFGNPSERQKETNYYDRLYDTKTLDAIFRAGSAFGCDAEVGILGREREFWGQTQTLDEWLRMFVPNGSLGKVVNPNKTWEYQQSKQP